jgi:hypothetical protein
LLAALPLAGLPAGAVPRPPADLPSDREVLGTAFIESWLVFRRELDSLAHLPVHPALLDSWFGGAPRFLLRDALALASEPRVVAAAARAIAENADADDRGLLAALERRHAGSPLADEIRGTRIRARDSGALALAQAGLTDPRTVVREHAAFALAAAGRKDGTRALRELVMRKQGGSPLAVRGLGLFGTPADARLLGDAGSGGKDAGIALAARGEIAMRQAFPEHHRALLARDCASARLRVIGGLYDAWLAVVHGALEGGARTSPAVVAHIESVRRAATGDEGEVVRRKLAALVEFWQQVDARLAATDGRPRWPAGMEAALALVRSPRRPDETPARAADRIAAIVAACAWAGEALGYLELAADRIGARAITPGGADALDGNLATALYLGRGGSFVLELPAGAKPTGIWIANSCPDGAGPRLRRIEVIASNGQARQAAAATLVGRTRYFQRLPLDGKPAGRIEIRALEIDGDGPACLAEIRVR